MACTYLNALDFYIPFVNKSTAYRLNIYIYFRSKDLKFFNKKYYKHYTCKLITEINLPNL